MTKRKKQQNTSCNIIIQHKKYSAWSSCLPNQHKSVAVSCTETGLQ